MKSRDADAVTALRTAIAAIDNGEAVDRPEREAATASEHFAGANVGVGSTEVARRNLTIDDVHAILQAQMTNSDDARRRPDCAARRARSQSTYRAEISHSAIQVARWLS
jgi:hypothetical protein